MADNTTIFIRHEKEIIKDIYKECDAPTRRLFGKKALSLGAITMLSGCTLTNEDSIEKALMVMSRF